MVIGIDEVGRGSWAGPMVIAGVVFERQIFFREIEKVNKGKLWKQDSEGILIGDSKVLSISDREKSARWIVGNSVNFVVEVSPEMINNSGIRHGWDWGISEVIRKFVNYDSKFVNCEILIDGNLMPTIGNTENVKCVVKGDQKFVEVAAASIIAKVYRDKLMRKLSLKFPNYGWDRNVGYGTREHGDGIKQYGVCDQHRTLWIRNILSK